MRRIRTHSTGSRREKVKEAALASPVFQQELLPAGVEMRELGLENDLQPLEKAVPVSLATQPELPVAVAVEGDHNLIEKDDEPAEEMTAGDLSRMEVNVESSDVSKVDGHMLGPVAVAGDAGLRADGAVEADAALEGSNQGGAAVMDDVAGLSLRKATQVALLVTPGAVQNTRKARVALKDLNNSMLPETPRRSDRLAGLPAMVLSLDDKATHTLMQEGGTLTKGAVPTEEDHKKFREQFATPLKAETVKGFRNMFGMDGKENCDSLHALVVEADGA